MKRVAVIGAGPSGLAQLHAFQSAAQKGAEIPDIVCYEKQDNWGGMWNYTWRTGLDEYGEPIHTSMYGNLLTAFPKECMEYPDYSFNEHFGKSFASYLPHSVIFDYIDGRAKKSDVRKWIRFRTPVRRVTYDEGKGMFSLTAHDLVNDTEYTEEFDFVVVATGHFLTPNAPYFFGIETFSGRLLHSHDLRNAVEFKDKDVLIIGSSFSAEDIALQCWKYGCKSVTISHGGASPIGHKWPDNIKEVPLLQKVSNNKCTFEDGSTTNVDAIILCTGYLHHFPFMADDLRLHATNRFAIDNLYKGVVWVDNPKLYYLGMHIAITFMNLDAQAWYVRDIIMGRIHVPDRDARLADVRERVVREDAEVKSLCDLFRLHVDHTVELLADTDCARLNTEMYRAALHQWDDDRSENILTYRDNCFKSAVTGTMSRLHHTPWKDAFDDSLECYLRD